MKLAMSSFQTSHEASAFGGFRKLRLVTVRHSALVSQRRVDTGLTTYNYRPRTIPGGILYGPTRYGQTDEFWDYTTGLDVFCSNSFLKRILVDLSNYKYQDDNQIALDLSLLGKPTLKVLEANAKEIRLQPKYTDVIGTLNLVPLCIYASVLDLLSVHSYAADPSINSGSLTYWLREVPEFIELNKFIFSRFDTSGGIYAILDYFMKFGKASLGNLTWLLENLESFYLDNDNEIQTIIKLNTFGKAK